MGTLDGKVAIVTGGGQGVGEGVALALADAGARVVVAGRTGSKVERTVATITDFLEQFAPLSLAAEWDNVGLLLGEDCRIRQESDLRRGQLQCSKGQADQCRIKRR